MCTCNTCKQCRRLYPRSTFLWFQPCSPSLLAPLSFHGRAHTYMEGGKKINFKYHAVVWKTQSTIFHAWQAHFLRSLWRRATGDSSHPRGARWPCCHLVPALEPRSSSRLQGTSPTELQLPKQARDEAFFILNDLLPSVVQAELYSIHCCF